MWNIRVSQNKNQFEVIVKEGNSQSRHIVTLPEDYYQKLTQTKISKEELIRKSFCFLLEREPKEAILNQFELSVIERYFPEYPKEIRR